MLIQLATSSQGNVGKGGPQVSKASGPLFLAEVGSSLEVTPADETTESDDLRIGFVASEIPNDLAIPGLFHLGRHGSLQFGQFFLDLRQTNRKLLVGLRHGNRSFWPSWV